MDIEKLFKEWIASKPDEQISYATAFQLLDFVAYVKKAVEQSVRPTSEDDEQFDEDWHNDQERIGDGISRFTRG